MNKVVVQHVYVDYGVIWDTNSQPPANRSRSPSSSSTTLQIANPETRNCTADTQKISARRIIYSFVDRSQYWSS